MKKFYIGLAVVLVAALGFSAVSLASANEASPIEGFRDAAFHGGKDGAIRELFLENLAEALGVSTEDLTARLEAGDKIPDILAEYGYEGEEIQEFLAPIHEATVNDALEQGLITEEQAERMLESGGRRGPGRRGPGRRGLGGIGDGVLSDYFKTALANELGISVEELEAMKEDGQKLTDLGYSKEELKEIFENAREAAIDQALADGVITEEDLENFQNRRQNRPEDESFGPGLPEDTLDG